MQTILVTGGAGYIGSHTCVELLEKNYEVIVIDNLINSSKESLNRVKKITGKSITFYEKDILDKDALDKIFNDHKIDAVIHFAGLKAVGESTQIPLTYYHNNLTGTLILLQAMQQASVFNLVFSSSATVYGEVNQAPYTEDMPLSATNPYGLTKVMIEQFLQDTYESHNYWNISILRYFNPVGAHKSGLIGEDPNGIPNNLMPYVSQVAVGKLKQLKVFGGDYPTIDGTGVRDYIHVTDLALGHIKALEKIASQTQTSIEAYNLGTGNGSSVLEVVNAFKEASSKDIPYDIVDRRPGDLAIAYANAGKAKAQLGWEANQTLKDMCQDTWNWQTNNPNGYR
ncbi:UDP-glucose 4-epimerase GalE [Marinomonas sp. TW1]|uniref:UDP-glucose 4-epimerase GalE n=1 Tax=Marinomonas sp. TW1 TaxID=1561203 RepID=UPI0007AFD7E5|nr:UDP-glucose 4-epimerase GalE [Marinomonas sp. TW1]KZN15062.1 UDP-galactose-4-epimerase [Marinomonas sp. TW1]